MKYGSVGFVENSVFVPSFFISGFGGEWRFFDRLIVELPTERKTNQQI